MVYKNSIGGRIFDVFNFLFMILMIVITLYPCYYVVVGSVSNPVEIAKSGAILLYPKGFSISSYKEILTYGELWRSYANTIIYVLGGTTIGVLGTLAAAFALTRKDLPGQNFFLVFLMTTMYIAGGTIPTFLVVRAVGLLDSPFTMMIMGVFAVYNIIVTMTYFRNMPAGLEEAAKIDGAGEFTVLFKILMPLAKPIIAVIALYIGVAIWNNYMTALLYLTNRKLFPLQLMLREILLQGNTSNVAAIETGSDAEAYAENLKYAVIVVSTIPILCAYPYLQKYFVKGVMVGAIKG